MKHTKYVVMLGTVSRGGIFTVIETYIGVGLFSKWNIKLIPTHRRGNLGVRIAQGLRSISAFLNMLILRRVSLVHIHVAMKGSFYRKSIFLILSKCFGVPVILHLHGSEFKRFFYLTTNRLHRSFIRSVFNMADSTIVLSKHWKEFLFHEVGVASKITILHNFVMDLAEDSEQPRREDYMVSFVGELCRRKGIFDLLKVIDRIRNRLPDIKLYCAGEGQIQEVRDQITTLKLKTHVELLGWVSGKAKEDLLKKSAILVLPSYNEGLPMVVLEAMAAGLPIVSTYAGGIPEAIDNGVEGLLVNAGDLDDLENALFELLLNPRLRHTMGRLARERYSRQFGPKYALPVLNNIYSSLIASSHHHP